MGKPRDLANVVATGNILADGAVAPAELTGVTSTAAEINILDGVTATAAELNLMDGVTATTAELNYVDGVTSAIQTQIDTKAPVAGPTFTGTLAAPTINASTALQIGGAAVTATAAELNKMDGVTVSASDINSVTTKAPTSGPTFTGTVTIGGATYPTSDGSSGQVLTTNGSGAVSFADPTGGGSADFVATGSISNGNVVTLKSDGTVGVVTTTDAVLNPVTFGSTATFSSSDVVRIASVYDPDTGKIVIGYQDTSNNYPYAVVGTVSGTSITFGTAVKIQSVNSGTYMKVVYDTTNNKHVFVFSEYISGQEEHGQAVVGTVSGTSISFGSVAEFENSSNPLVTYIDAVYDSVNGKVVIVWNNSVATNRGLNAIVGTVSGTSISFGSRAIANATSGTHVWCGYDVNAGKVLLGYRTSSPYPSYVGSVSGTSITFGSVVSYTSQNPSGTRTVYDSNAQKILIVYRVGGGGNENTISRVATISGTSVSYGNEVTVNSVSSSGDEDFGLAFSTITNTILISFRDNNDSTKVKLIRGTISGTTLGSLQTEVSTNISQAGVNSTHPLVYDTANKKFVLAVSDDDDGDKGKAIVIADVTTTTDADNYIGIAEAAISNSATGTITIEGGINESQSSLSIGTNYFVADNGSLTTSNTGRRLGKAVSTTKILLDFGIKNVTATEAELNFVDGVTSAIQTQLDAKLPLAGGTMTGALVINNTLDIEEVKEKVSVSSTDIVSGSNVVAVDLLDGAIDYFTSNASGNWILNFRGDGSTTLNSIMSTGQSMTYALLVTNGGTPRYGSAYQVDGSSVTPKWAGGSAPTAGNASSIDSYSFTIIKTANATFTVLASLTQFA